MWRWDQAEPFGDSPADENPSGAGAFDLPLRLPGQYYDAESGLEHNYFRDYDPAVGRYSRSDPIGLRGGINTYAYSRSNPLQLVDVLGLSNGCGPEGGWFNWLIPNNPGYDFKGCCDQHDDCYGNCKTRPTKYECDQDFFNCLSSKCKGAIFGLLCQRLANTYTFWVSGPYGRPPFNSARAKCPNCKGDKSN